MTFIAFWKCTIDKRDEQRGSFLSTDEKWSEKERKKSRNLNIVNIKSETVLHFNK